MSDLFSPVTAPLLLTTHAFLIGEICRVDAKHVLSTFFHSFYLFFKEKLGNLPSWCATLQSTSRIQPPASSCLDERQERQMGSVISSDYISAQRNMKEMQFLRRPLLGLFREEESEILPESGEMRIGQKFMQITKIGWDSFATVVRARFCEANFWQKIWNKRRGSQTTKKRQQTCVWVLVSPSADLINWSSNPFILGFFPVRSLLSGARLWSGLSDWSALLHRWVLPGFRW